MFEEKVSFAELEVAQGTSVKIVYLQTTLLDNGMSGFKLVLTDGEDVWKGKVSEDDLDTLCTRLKMEFKKFVTQSVSALTRESLQDLTFEYHLKALPADRMQLVWKKCIAADDIKFQLGHVNLERVDSQSQFFCNMLSQCVTLISSLKRQLGNLESDNERLARDRANAIKRLDKCVAAKTELESDFFSKFVAILNSKKERIRDLEDGTQEITRDRSPIAGPSKRDSPELRQPSITARNDKVSSKPIESTPCDVDTDEETEKPPRKQVRGKFYQASLEDSVNLGDEEEEPVTGPAARRARRKTPTKKPAVSKPILPKVSSSPSIESASRRTSLRKSGSGNSKSSENTDDLLAQI